MEELISVIVPIYNTEEYLDKCIESLVNQTYGNLEIILVNDGSSDSSHERCLEWMQRDGRIVVLEQQNKGAAAARNYGMSLAKGECFSFIDSDDWIDLRFIEKMSCSMKKNNADIVICDTCRVLGNTQYYISASGDISNRLPMREYAMIYGLKSTCTTLSRRTLWEDNSIRFPEIPFEDVAIKALLLACALRIYFLQEGLYYYRGKRPGSCTEAVGRRYLYLIDSFEFLIHEFKIRNIYDYYEEILYRQVKNSFAQILISLNYDEKLVKTAERHYQKFLDEKFPLLAQNEKRICFALGSYNLGKVQDELTIFGGRFRKFQFTSLISLVSPKKLVINFEHDNPYRYQMLKRDLEKSFWEILQDSKFEYLLLDFLEERYDILEYKGGYYTKSEALEETGNVFEEAEIILRTASECERLWKTACMEFIKRIKLIIKPQQIILVKNYLSEEYGDGQRRYQYKEIEAIRSTNDILKGYYDFFETQFPGIQVAEGCSSENSFTDEKFRHGRNPWHLNVRAYREIAGNILGCM